jgi:ribosome-associated protein
MAGVLRGQIELAKGVALPAAALRFRYTASSGPGGQNVNKLNTKAVLTVRLDDLAEVLTPAAMQRLRQLAGHHLAGEALVIAGDEHRSQSANREACLDRLRALVIQARRRPRKRRPTRPTRASQERRIEHKKQRSRIKRQRRGRYD